MASAAGGERPAGERPGPEAPGGRLELSGFVNRVGRHCSSSALRSVLAYDGIDVSEGACFGLGSGLGFFYNREPGRSPSRRFNGRAPDLEGAFYALAGSPITWAGSYRPELIRRALEAGRPVLAQTDIFPIPYYDATHFLGHGLVVVGMEGQEVVVADIQAPGLSRMSLRQFHAAVAPHHPPLNQPFGYAAAPRLRALDPAGMAGEAIRRTVGYMLEPPGTGEGVSGMRRMAEELPEWPALEDAAWCARFGYQAVEKRGTGGGNFRPLYADFLEEMAALGLPLGAHAARCRALGRGWTTFAATLKRLAFAQGAPQAVSAARRAGAELKALADAEEGFLEGLAQAVEGA